MVFLDIGYSFGGPEPFHISGLHCNETEFPNRNLSATSGAQQNHGTHEQSSLYNGDSSSDDNSRDSRVGGRKGNRGRGRGRGGRGRGAPNPFTANHQRQPSNY